MPRRILLVLVGFVAGSLVSWLVNCGRKPESSPPSRGELRTGERVTLIRTTAQPAQVEEYRCTVGRVEGELIEKSLGPNIWVVIVGDEQANRRYWLVEE